MTDRESALENGKVRARRLSVALATGQVKRCHALPTVGEYNLAEHQWGCAVVLKTLFPDRFDRLVSFALFHDVGEFVVGDVPSPVIKAAGLADAMRTAEDRFAVDYLGLYDPSTLTETDRDVVRFCDVLELFVWSKRQMMLGNSMIRACHTKCWSSLFEIAKKWGDGDDPPAPVNEIYNLLYGIDGQYDPWLEQPEFVEEAFGVS